MNYINTKLSNKKIVLGLTGGIAAYKSAELVRLLRGAGSEVKVVMTKNAQEFITPLTLQTLSGNTVHTELFDQELECKIGHISLARWADLILIAPASANVIARLAHGIADDLLTTVCLATRAPIAIAPAMNVAMWEHIATRQNVQRIRECGVHIFGPDIGTQACGEVGEGRMLEPMQIIDRCANLFDNNLLSGKKIVITSGPTREAIDPVRYISNYSSGKMGYALAEAAALNGAEVVLISGPTYLSPPSFPNIELINVVSAREMLDAAITSCEFCDIFIAAAAVADYRPAVKAAQKIKKDYQGKSSLHLDLEVNPDIIATIATHAQRPRLVIGFAAETENLLENARLKLHSKNLDMIIANQVGDDIGFNCDDNTAMIVLENGAVIDLPKTSKTNLAQQLIKIIAGMK